MREWDGKSKGGVLGYKAFVFFIKKLGIRPAYAILFPVVFFYFLFLSKVNKASYYYFNKRQGFGRLTSVKSIFWTYYTFGQVLIDRIAVSIGMRNAFSYGFDGSKILRDALGQKKGGVLITGHTGNFEIAQYFLSELDYDLTINFIGSYIEHEAIKKYLEGIYIKSGIKYIIVKDDMSHIFEINEALSNNELLCFAADRYPDGSRTLTECLLGKEADFPAGPFLISSRLKAPVLFVYVMKEAGLKYQLYAREAQVTHRDAQGLLQEYIKSLEFMLKRYPLQWFNYYDFWKALKSRQQGPKQ